MAGTVGGAILASLIAAFHPNDSAYMVLAILFAGFAFVVLLGTVFPLLLQALNGDQITIEETKAVLPEAIGVVVKQAVTRFSAESLHPAVACSAIRAGARTAVERAVAGEIGPPPIELPAHLEVDWLTADMAEMATSVGGIERRAARTVEIRGDDPLGIFRGFVAAIAITRSIVEA